jgi:hypothetical protein
MRSFPLRTDYGEEETAGSSGMVESRCENLKGSGESEAIGTSGGEEAASYSERGCAEGDGVGCAVQVDQSKARRLRMFATRDVLRLPGERCKF